MHTLVQMVAQGYRLGAPSQEAEDIDTQVAEGLECPKCHSPIHYEGYHRRSRGYAEYIALAVCDNCHYQRAF